MKDSKERLFIMTETTRCKFFRKSPSSGHKDNNNRNVGQLTVCGIPCQLSAMGGLKKGISFKKKLHRVVCVIRNKRSFESFMCLDPVGRRWCVQHERAGTPGAVVASLR